MCDAQLQNGKKCKSPPLANKRFCYFHDPEVKQFRLSSCSNGGKARRFKSTKVNLGDISTPEGVTSARIELIRLVAENKIELKRSKLLSQMLAELASSFKGQDNTGEDNFF